MKAIQQYNEKRHFQETLAAAGIKRPPLLRRFGTPAIVLLFALIVTTQIVAELSNKKPEWSDSLQALAGFAAFSLGYLQWRAARHETTFDKLYDKLDIANRKFDAWKIEQLKNDPKGLADHLHTMFVFAELDNLEYVLEKYQLGYAREELAERAWRSFKSRCIDSEAFRKCALHFLGEKEGGEIALGFQKTTRMVVRHVCLDCHTQSGQVLS